MLLIHLIQLISFTCADSVSVIFSHFAGFFSFSFSFLDIYVQYMGDDEQENKTLLKDAQ